MMPFRGGMIRAGLPGVLVLLVIAAAWAARDGMVSGHDQLSTAVEAMREGAYDYLPKPVTLGLLLLRVNKALERRALLLENKGHREPEQSPMPRKENAAESTVTPQDAFSDLGAEVESLADHAKGIGTEPTEFIMTGERVLDEKLGGGLPCGSLTLVEGASSSGKSVLCQHLIYGALTAGRGVACYSSEFTFKSLLTRMHSIGLDLSDAPKGVKLTVEALEDPLPDED